MNSSLNKLSIHRGESFTIDKIVRNKDGSPYAISNRLNNPYILVTIANNRYGLKDKREINFWLDMSDTPRFDSTIAISIPSFSSWTAVQDQESGQWFITQGAEGEQYSMNNLFVAVIDGKNVYKYPTLDDNTLVVWNEYEMRIILPVTAEISRTLTEQQYIYAITLVAGPKMEDYIDALCIQNGVGRLLPLETKYELLIEKGVKFDSRFDIHAKLGTYDVNLPILTPTPLNVISNIGGIYG